MGIIRDILAAYDDITYRYTISKFPKFIKEFEFNHSIKKIDKIIDKLKSSDITGLVIEYMEVLLELYPPFGRFEHCASVKLINENYSSTFEYDILKSKNDNYHVIVDIYQTPNGGFDKFCSARFYIYHNGNMNISFSIPLNNLVPKTLEDPNRMEIISAEARIEFSKTIQNDIVHFFNRYKDNCTTKVKLNG